MRKKFREGWRQFLLVAIGRWLQDVPYIAQSWLRLLAKMSVDWLGRGHQPRKANSGTFKAREQSRPDTELIQKVHGPEAFLETALPNQSRQGATSSSQLWIDVMLIEPMIGIACGS
eukprot:symbB.v1.2.020938.t1/scaffold1787.1/size187711/12